MDDERIDQLIREVVRAARKLMAEVLESDAALHEQGRFTELGKHYDEVDYARPRCSDQLAIAGNFYDFWISERNHEFAGYAQGIAKDDWPRLARYIADRLTTEEEIADPLILSHFDPRPRTPLLTSLKRLFRRQPN
jgi:hypothetical protein